jgi:phosphatidylglycerophosphate synthase
LPSGSRRIARKTRTGTEVLCEWLFRPLAHLVVLVLRPLRVPPPVLAGAAAATGLAAAVELARGGAVAAALLVQAKTVLDNADGQLARASGRVTLFGRYLDSELDLLVNAALFAAVAWETGEGTLSLAGFAALTLVLSVNFNAERLYRLAHGEPADAPPAETTRPERALRRAYRVVYGPQDRLIARFVEQRLRDASIEARRRYHDRTTVTVLANLGMSTQLAAFGLCIAVGRPLAFAWLAVGELGLVALLAARRELLVRNVRRLTEGAV